MKKTRNKPADQWTYKKTIFFTLLVILSHKIDKIYGTQRNRGALESFLLFLCNHINFIDLLKLWNWYCRSSFSLLSDRFHLCWNQKSLHEYTVKIERYWCIYMRILYRVKLALTQDSNLKFFLIKTPDYKLKHLVFRFLFITKVASDVTKW